MQGLLKRVGLEVVGWGLLLAGIAALVLPGPGLLMMFAGLGVLSQQYEWAERRLAPVKYRALKGAAVGVESVPKIVLSVLGVLFLWACAVLWIVKPAAPGWWPAGETWWLLGGATTGVTLAASGLVALTLVVYSYRRFRGHPEELAALDAEIDEADRESETH